MESKNEENLTYKQVVKSKSREKCGKDDKIEENECMKP